MHKTRSSPQNINMKSLIYTISTITSPDFISGIHSSYCLSITRVELYFTTGLEMPNKTRREEFGEFIDNCRKLLGAEEKVEKWMTKQAVRCLK